MGGFGSGRPAMYSTSKVEDCYSLNVNNLQRHGHLRFGSGGNLYWTRNGRKVASTTFRVGEDVLILTYMDRPHGGEWEEVKETIQIVRNPCRYGGTRPYLICPGVVNGIICGRRVIKLYAAGKFYLCRCCYRLKYSSQYESSWDRAMAHANKIRKRLGGEWGMESLLPPRPKGMWHRTYDRLCNEVYLAEAKGDRDFLDYMMKRTSGFRK